MLRVAQQMTKCFLEITKTLLKSELKLEGLEELLGRGRVDGNGRLVLRTVVVLVEVVGVALALDIRVHGSRVLGVHEVLEVEVAEPLGTHTTKTRVSSVRPAAVCGCPRVFW